MLEQMDRHWDTANRQRMTYDGLQGGQEQKDVPSKFRVEPHRRTQRGNADAQQVALGFIYGANKSRFWTNASQQPFECGILKEAFPFAVDILFPKEGLLVQRCNIQVGQRLGRNVVRQIKVVVCIVDSLLSIDYRKSVVTPRNAQIVTSGQWFGMDIGWTRTISARGGWTLWTRLGNLFNLFGIREVRFSMQIFQWTVASYKFQGIFVQIDHHQLMLVNRTFSQKISMQRFRVDNVLVLLDQQQRTNRESSTCNY